MRSWILVLAAPLFVPLASCSQSSSSATPGAAADQPQVGTLAYDKNLWQELLYDHTKVRRLIRHTPTGVETLTESDDPAVRAKIVEHAFAMQKRMQSGARVRVWDPVFKELFEHHEQIRIEVNPTDLGVQITETSNDPEALALLRSHAMGVSDFVRHSSKAAAKETPRFKAGDALPLPEVAIGGVPHRFVLGQPDAPGLAAMKDAGVTMVVSFRKPGEHPEFDEKAAAGSAGAAYCNVPYQGAAGLTDEVLAEARKAMKAADEKGDVALLHCRTGNRVGAVWAAYRVLDKGVPVEQAVGEARMMSTSPELIARVREYVAGQKKS